MDASLKKTLKAVTLELRHLLEGHYDAAGKWHPGDLEDRLAAIGVRRDRESVAVDELGHLPDEDKHARKVVDAYLRLREEAGVPRTEAVADFVRETAYTWANRLVALRCMEARELIDEVILQKEVYGGRSLEHHRLAQREPEHCTGEDDGRFVMLQRVFAKQAEHLPMLFDPQSPGVALRPSPAVLKQCIALLSGTATVRSHEPATGDVFKAPDSLGWAYQYWNTEEKDRVFEKVRTQKGAKIEGADIVPATQLYTESYMVQFLVQNSLGATWMGMHPDSKLYEQWDYYVRDADRAQVERKPVRKLTFLDPACGSGHFLLEAFDLLYAMYEESAERGWDSGIEGLGDRGLGLETKSESLVPSPKSLTPERDHHDGKQLQRSSGLAEVDGVGASGVLGVEAVSEGGAVCTDESGSASGSVDSVEHRGRSREGLDEGLSEISVDRAGITGGSGNSTDSGKGPRIHADGPPESNAQSDNGDRQNAPRTAKVAPAKTLAPSPYTLTPDQICDAILTQNLYGIDIDARSVQIAEVALWMKAAEKSFDYAGVPTNLVAAVSSHLKGPHWDEFLAGFEKEPSVARVLRKFGESMEHIDELGSLARPNEDLKKIIAEEHAVWEQQVREQKEANYLFPEMRKEAASGKLAFNEIDDEEFGDRLFYRARAALDGFTEQARERGEFQDQFLAREASTGFKLLDVLGGMYDVVAANPPYMGSKNMGPLLRAFVGTTYSTSKRDLYGAFLDRALLLRKPYGRTAFVTMDGWCFKKHFSGIRSKVLDSSSIICIAYLGRHAFSDADPPGLPVMCVFQESSPQDNSSIWSVRMTASREANEQGRLLHAACREANSSVNRTRQRSLANIPNAGFFTWIPNEVLEALSEYSRIGDKAECLAGLQTGDSPRFVRFNWEIPADSDQWIGFASGGGISKWYGLERQSLHWRQNGKLIKEHPKSCWRGTHRFLQRGFTYSESARGKLALREMTESGFSQSGSAVFPEDRADSAMLLALGSSRFASYCARFLRPGRVFPVGYLSLVPVPRLRVSIDVLVQTAVATKQRLVELDPLERSFAPDNYNVSQGNLLLLVATIVERELLLSAALHAIEGQIEREVFRGFGLSDSVVETIVGETGTPVGWHPAIAQHFATSVIDVPNDVISCCRVSVESRSDDDIDYVHKMLKRLYEAGPANGIAVDGDDEADYNTDSDDEDETSDSLSGIPIPPETFLEELAAKTRLHPLSVASIILPPILSRKWRCAAEEARIIRNMISVQILWLFGFRWTHQTSCTQLSDLDGIIPLIDPPMASREGEKTLITRVMASLEAFNDSEEGSAFTKQFEAIMGFPIARWLTHEFFAHHATQFKKRPVVWQLQSNSFTARSGPAYACLAYYHKLDADLIRKVRKQAEDVRKSFETELRGITSMSADARSDRQALRRVYLEDGIGELQRFDATLGQLIQRGFGPEPLIPTLRQYAIDDATLAMKARWLRRLSSLVADTTLADWLSAATAAEIHDELPDWITQAVTHLNHHCATIGIKPPKAKDVGDEPTSAELAPLICAESAEMLSGSLKCACDVWWKQFDNTVLGPLKEQVKEMKNERKEIKARLNGDPPPAPDDVTELTLRDRALREDIKPIEKQIKRLKTKATALRKNIEAWTSAELLSWEPWLAEQPLFDEVTSIDGRKAPPATIAEFIAQESAYIPDINDGVRVNIAPLQKAGILAADVLAKKDVDKAIADRAEWRADERRWVRQGKLPQPGWWPEENGNET